MPTGTIKFYSDDRGFGFVTDESGRDIFFHISNCADDLEPSKGQRVTFDERPGRNGRNEAFEVAAAQ
jgi:cold shock protein